MNPYEDRDAAERGLGPESAGLSGDTQGLSRDELADSQSVDDLIEEGQAFEAGVVSGVENAPPADESEASEVHTHEVLQDDVPLEYLDDSPRKALT
jgi:hypothetical protein